MAKKTEPPVGRPTITPDKAIIRLNQRVRELEEFDPATVSERWSAEVQAIESGIEDTLSKAFGHNSADYNRYSGAIRLDNGPLYIDGRGNARWDVQKYLEDGKKKSLLLLRQAVQSLTETIEDAEPATSSSLTEQSTNDAENLDNNRIFIVHGRDEGPREAVARFLFQLGFEPVILNEQPNKGLTIIEKIEHYGKVRFAVVLLTPDDFGGLSGEAPQPRARQNVVLELGYFVGKLGRQRVCTFKKSNVEIPSDWQGIVNGDFDSGGAWKMSLAQELQAAGYAFDWNRVMKPNA